MEKLINDLKKFSLNNEVQNQTQNETENELIQLTNNIILKERSPEEEYKYLVLMIDRVAGVLDLSNNENIHDLIYYIDELFNLYVKQFIYFEFWNNHLIVRMKIIINFLEKWKQMVSHDFYLNNVGRLLSLAHKILRHTKTIVDESTGLINYDENCVDFEDSWTLQNNNISLY
jgi:hypothetical protein